MASSLLRALLVGVLLGVAPVAPAETDDPMTTGGAVDVEIDSAIQALRGRIVGETGDMLQVQTTTRQVVVHAPPGFSAPLDACIQVSGQVPLGSVFEAEQASLVPADERAAACP